MKRALIIPVILLFCALRAAEAGVPKIDIYADVDQTSCELNDNVQPPVVFVYYFLSGATGATAVRFSAPKPACWLGATFAGDSNPYVNFGTSQGDWSIGIAPCRSGTVYLGKTAYLVSGQGTPCCQLSAVRSPYAFEYADCSFVTHPVATGQKLTINPDASCHCQQPLATEATTWGRVKSLYR